MPDKKFEKWRNRLRWAKRIHMGMGLIGRESEKPMMRQLIEFYRSNQWQNKGSFGDLSPDVLRIVNKIFPIANRQQAGIAARNPRTRYFPRREQDKPRAPFAEALHNYDIEEDDHITEMNAALRDAQFAPFPGVIRHGYTPEREIRDDDGKLIAFNPQAHPTRPWIRRVAPWDVLIDPRARDFGPNGGALWCAFRDIFTVEQIRRNPNMIARERLKDFRGNTSGPYLDMIPDDLKAKEDPDLGQYVEVWTIYDLEEREWMQLTLDGVDDWLRKPAEWRIPWEGLPLSTFIVNPQMDTPFPKSLMEDLIPLQEELNQVRTMASLFVRQLRRILLWDENKLGEGTRSLIDSAALVEHFLLTGNPNEAVQALQMGGFPQEIIQYVAMIADDMRESVGLSLFARARRENVESAQEAAQIAQGQDIIEARTQDAFDRFVEHAERVYMQGRRAVLAETGATETIRILGAEGAQSLEQWVNVDAETLHGEYGFSIEAGSTRPQDQDREAQLAAVDLNVSAQFPAVAQVDQFFRRYVEARRLDPARYMQGDARQAATTQGAGALAREAGLDGESGGLDANSLSLFTGGAAQ